MKAEEHVWKHNHKTMNFQKQENHLITFRYQSIRSEQSDFTCYYKKYLMFSTILPILLSIMVFPV